MVTGKQYADEALKVISLKPQAGYIWGTAGVFWTEKRQANIEKTTDPDRESARKYGKKWIGHMVWDCSGLTYYCGKLLGLKYYHGSNSSWNRDCQAKGKLKKNMEIPVGAFVYTGTDDKKPHIGIYTGDGLVTEASGTIKGVIKTKLTNTKWKYWGLGKGITFDFIPNSDTVKQETKPMLPKTIRRGDKGSEVVLLQNLLVKDGSNVAVDGIFGPGTQSAVRAFQKRHGLVVDGIVGPKTWTELNKVA